MQKKKMNIHTEDTTSHGEKKEEKKKEKKRKKENVGAGLQTREVLLHILMALPLRHGALNLPRPFTLTFCTPTHACTPSRSSCQRCQKDKQSPKLFSSDSNMDPGSVPVQQQMHDEINCKKESYRLSSTCGALRNHTNVPPVDAHV